MSGYLNTSVITGCIASLLGATAMAQQEDAHPFVKQVKEKGAEAALLSVASCDDYEPGLFEFRIEPEDKAAVGWVLSYGVYAVDEKVKVELAQVNIGVIRGSKVLLYAYNHPLAHEAHKGEIHLREFAKDRSYIVTLFGYRTNKIPYSCKKEVTLE